MCEKERVCLCHYCIAAIYVARIILLLAGIYIIKIRIYAHSEILGSKKATGPAFYLMCSDYVLYLLLTTL